LFLEEQMRKRIYKGSLCCKSESEDHQGLKNIRSWLPDSEVIQSLKSVRVWSQEPGVSYIY